VSRYACRRCDWTPTGDQARAQLADHATEANHPTCPVCLLSLDRTERQVCVMCVGQVRRDLHRIVDLYAALPGELGHPRGAKMDPSGEGTHDDEQPLPGGQILPLLAGGSKGLTQITGAPTTAGGRDFSHDADEHISDPQSVAFELSRHEDLWRQLRAEPAAETTPTVTVCSDYLFRHLPWAADQLEDFRELSDDLHTIRTRLEIVTANDERPQVGVPCFEEFCGADLIRKYGEDHYTCPRCRRQYDDASYWLAVRAQLEEEAR
jgi:hypothetical protein